jgi:hypothetical protein
MADLMLFSEEVSVQKPKRTVSDLKVRRTTKIVEHVWFLVSQGNRRSAVDQSRRYFEP